MTANTMLAKKYLEDLPRTVPDLPPPSPFISKGSVLKHTKEQDQGGNRLIQLRLELLK